MHPHPISGKECAVGCAGIYTAYTAMELYATVFEVHNALDKLEGFSSLFGPRFYNLPVNQKKSKLVKKPFDIPAVLSYGSDQLVPFEAGQTLVWTLV